MFENIMILQDSDFSVESRDFPGGLKVWIKNNKNGLKLERIVSSQGQSYAVAQDFAVWKEKQRRLNRGFIVIPIQAGRQGVQTSRRTNFLLKEMIFG